MNPIIAIFALIGMVVIGYLLALIIVPFILFTMRLLVELVLLILRKKAHHFTCNPINNTEDSEPKINEPENIQYTRNAKIKEQPISQIPTITQFNKCGNGKGDKYPLYIIFQFVTNQLDKVLYRIHAHNYITSRVPNDTKSCKYLGAGIICLWLL